MSAISKPSCYLFLDIDGVLIRDRFNGPLKEKTEKKVAKLFGQKKEYSRLEWKRAASRFFDPKARNHLKHLIQKIEESFQVHIVISSEWRRDISVRKLRKLVLRRTGISRLIIGKTAEDKLPREEQINHWLGQRQKHYPINAFVALDDHKLVFENPDNFVQVDPEKLLTANKVNEAYGKVMHQLHASSTGG